ncbi:MAG: hypothetical protein LBJ83_01990 [Oscillospiraceae bacterium]|jgi:hypothetical protein|nr:hypothetical protein [Oscillospiraceae bacterium]
MKPPHLLEESMGEESGAGPCVAKSKCFVVEPTSVFQDHCLVMIPASPFNSKNRLPDDVSPAEVLAGRKGNKMCEVWFSHSDEPPNLHCRPMESG